MPSVNVQFHMLPEELIRFVADMMEHYSLSVELLRWFPKSVQEISASADVADAIRNFGHLDCLQLMYRPSRSKKPERFVINVGLKKENRLSQAQLGAGTSDDEAFKILKKIAAELKRRTTAGIWIIAANGSCSFTKLFRISPGAAEASKAGEIELAGIAFLQEMKTEPPEISD